MPAPRVRRTAAARKDYADVWDYLADAAGEDIADAVLRAFDRKLELLARFPYLGRARDEIRPRLRSVSVGNYLLFYEVPPRGAVQLIRVLHASRDVRRVFRRRKQ